MSPASPDRDRRPDDDGDRRESSLPPVASSAAPLVQPANQLPPVGSDPGPAPGPVTATRSGPVAAPAPAWGIAPGSGPVAAPVLPAPRERRPARTLGVGVAVTSVITVLGAPLGLLWWAMAPSVPVTQTSDGPVLTQPQPEQFIAADGWFSLLGLGFGVLVALAGWVVLRRYRGPAALVMLTLGSLGAAVLAWRLGRAIGLDDFRHLLASAPPGATVDRPPDLRAGRFDWLYGVIPTLQGALLMPAFGVVVSYTLLAGWSRYPDLRPEPEPGPYGAGDPTLGVAAPVDPTQGVATPVDPTPGVAVPGESTPGADGPGESTPGPLSWGSSAPRTPPAEPAPPAPGAAEPPPG